MHVRTSFKRPPAASQPSTDRTPADADLPLNAQTLDHFVERHVLAIVDHLDNERLVCIQARGPSPTLRPG